MTVIRRLPTGTRLAASLCIGGFALAGCGSDSSGGAASDRPTVVVTTSILGDVVEQLVGDAATVTVLMPRGASPHDFAPSAQQIASLSDAALVVANGAGFEAGLADALEAAETDGVEIIHAIDAVDALMGGEHHHDDEEAGHEEEAGHDEEEAGVDPHFFTDPARMAVAAQAIADAIETIEGIDSDAVATAAAAYIEQLAQLDAEVETLVATLPSERRILVTNHEVFAYFADRYGFEVAGVVIPGGTTNAEPSAADLAELAAVIESEGVPAIFADSSAPAKLADALAAEVGEVEVEVVELFSESLGEADGDGATYVEMVRTNAQRIVEALLAS